MLPALSTQSAIGRDDGPTATRSHEGYYQVVAVRLVLWRTEFGIRRRASAMIWHVKEGHYVVAHGVRGVAGSARMRSEYPNRGGVDSDLARLVV